MASPEERIAKLEARVDVMETYVKAEFAESAQDRKELHRVFTELKETLSTWRDKQSGYIAGASFVIGLILSAVAVGWRELFEFFRGH
jgi:hypothetical protein